MKKILVITYYWPPAGGPGVQRILKFAKYLPEFGYKPIILTVKNGDYPANDYSLMKEIPDKIKVVKTKVLEPYNLYRKILGKKPETKIPVAILAQKKNLSKKEILMHWIRKNIFIPDARIAWNYHGFLKAQEIIRKDKIEMVLISSPPHSIQLIGYRLKKKFDLPLICDFRDPWTDIHYYENLNRLSLSKKIDQMFEKKVIDCCDRLITVSPALKRYFLKKNKESNCSVIYNGYDKSDFQEVKNKIKSERFLVSYIGNFKDNQNIESIWQAIAELITTHNKFAKDFRLKLTGRVNNDVIDSIKKFNLFEFTEIEGYVSHKEAINRMCAAAVLLFIIPRSEKNEGILTGKIFDYLASETPFLSIGNPHGDAEKLLKKTNAGPMFDYNQKNKIKDRLLNLYNSWEKGKLDKFKPVHDRVIKYNRKSLTRKLAAILDEI